jgi:hypothetical protein
MEKKNAGKIVLAIGAVIAAAGLIYLLKPKTNANVEVPAAEPATEAKKTKTDSGDMLIENYDKTWDYKFAGDRWYTKKKTSTEWLDMKDHLSAENYAIAIKRLSDFLKK